MTQVAAVRLEENTKVQVVAEAQILGDNVTPQDGGMYSVPLKRIKQTPEFKNPRKHRNKADFDDLREAIKQEGVLQPIVLRITEPDAQGADLEVVAGETRYLCSLDLGLFYIPAITRVLTLREATIIAGMENMSRSDMTEVEEGLLAAELLASFNNDRAEVMNRLDWSESKLNSRLAITKVTEYVQNMLVQKNLYLGHVELLAGIPLHRQDVIAEKIIENGYTVADTRKRLGARKRSLKVACFPKDECNGCQFNSSTTADMFKTQADVDKEFCSNDDCWNQKTKAALNIIATDAREDFGTVYLSSELGDNGYTHLEEKGENGVGAAQKAQCASCEHYGAVVSVVFGTEGQVSSGLCFNLECNAEKVTAYRTEVAKAARPTASQPTEDTPPTTQQEGATEGQQGGEAPAKKDAAKTPAALTPDTLRKGIRQEAVNRFRAMGEAGVKAHPRIGMAIALFTLYKDIDTHSFSDEVRKQAKAIVQGLMEEGKALPALNENATDNAATGLARLPESRLIEAMTALGSLTVWRDKESDQFNKHPATQNSVVYAKVSSIEPKQYICMTPEYRKAQVKAMLVEDCVKSGFADAYDDVKGEGAFAKLSKGKASDLNKAIEALPFDWHGYEPTGFSYGFYGF